MLGTVTKITDTEITVETQTKEVQVVKLAPDTSFVKSGASATLKDLKVGDRVVIHAKPVGSDLIAHEVRFGKQAPAAAASSTRRNRNSSVISTNNVILSRPPGRTKDHSVGVKQLSPQTAI